MALTVLTRASRVDEGRRSRVHTVTFDRDITRQEFADWLDATGWCGYDPRGYGLGTVRVEGNVGTYEHPRSSGD